MEAAAAHRGAQPRQQGSLSCAVVEAAVGRRGCCGGLQCGTVSAAAMLSCFLIHNSKPNSLLSKQKIHLKPNQMLISCLQVHNFDLSFFSLKKGMESTFYARVRLAAALDSVLEQDEC